MKPFTPKTRVALTLRGQEVIADAEANYGCAGTTARIRAERLADVLGTEPEHLRNRPPQAR